jgi:hypothetical protein
MYKENNPRITCKNGVSLSVQGSRAHYCSPRDDIGPYDCVEVGFPSVCPPASWEEFCEDWSDPTETVYGYVPIELVEEFIEQNGGLLIGRLP